MYILGVNISHHASVCLLKDGEVVFYLEDDRLSGDKEAEWWVGHDMPSLEKILEYTDYVDCVAVSSFGRGGFEDNDITNYLLHK